MLDQLKNFPVTDSQLQTATRMLSAPAGGWVLTRVVKPILLGIPCEGVAVQIESTKLGVWGVILPDGQMIKPKPGRKSISAADIAFKC